MSETIEDYRAMDRATLNERVQGLPWFHEFDLGDGIHAHGRTKTAELRALADVFFPASLAGKTMLDIGCYDGFFSFEAARRGARVLATDHHVWNADPRTRQTFLIARSCLAPDLEYRDIDWSELTPESVGRFDVVLFSGVLYHLRHPLWALERVAALATETLIVETHLDATHYPRPAMVFYPGTELNGDPTNWWGPNRGCVEAMLKDVGFADVTYQPNPNWPTSRGVFHARGGVDLGVSKEL